MHIHNKLDQNVHNAQILEMKKQTNMVSERVQVQYEIKNPNPQLLHRQTEGLLVGFLVLKTNSLRKKCRDIGKLRYSLVLKSASNNKG